MASNAAAGAAPFVARQQPPEPPAHGHQRSKSSVLKSFIHRRKDSDGSALPPVDLRAPVLPQVLTRPSPDDMQQMQTNSSTSSPSKRPTALGEIQNTRVEGPPLRSPTKQLPDYRSQSRSQSPTKPTITAPSFYQPPGAEYERAQRDAYQKDQSSLHKPKKTKSATNLVGILTRPKTLKSMVSDDSYSRPRKDKENRTPPSSVSTPQEQSRPPIYAQFASGALDKPVATMDYFRHASGNTDRSSSDISAVSNNNKKPRPQSYHAGALPSDVKSGYSSVKATSPSKTQRGLKVLTRGLLGSKSEESPIDKTEPVIDPKDIDKHLEAMLDRRNIPENQRYKMRNLADTIKMEFIRQDWAETHMAPGRPSMNDSECGTNDGSIREGSEKKKSRGMTFTLSRNSKKTEPISPAKKSNSQGTLGRHFRSRSTDSITSERPSSSGSGTTGGGILSKIKAQQGPAEFVAYLRKVQKPELVEVGKLHKLRLLLRNETVAWTDEFVRQGGMEEIVGLLHRIMDVEWREEHEDALLHENLLCLKALCTTGLALQYLHSIQGRLFPALLHLIFDPEKKGPSEFTTRGIITSVLFTYIQSASAEDRVVRAKTILNHLRDPEPKDDERPLEFVMEMRRERPYRVWSKEAVSVTKEVFWIFLHHLNVVFLPRDKEQTASCPGFQPKDSLAYMSAHFPQERPPVPAAPYVGGVEWDATNYLASHLDLLNAIIACTPTREERNKLRELLRISGWERCMGGSLRLCKEKFYPGVHDALRTWVAAAYEDEWEVRDVRYGPPPEAKSPVKSSPNKGKKQGEMGPPPKIEIPRLDFALDAMKTDAKKVDDWLS
ncbi:armadillo-type protein [Pestalotiopsis sp. NC0098]|nr:armadillo-type protein [Pestalotiopsis sp. NC0098]